MSAYTPIDLSRLPSPAIVEVLDYEVILAQMLEDFRQRDPAYSAIVESDPAFKILEVAAYRELLIRQRINDALKSVLLAYSSGTITYDGDTPRYAPGDLDHLGALLGVARKVLTPADPGAVPPAPALYEADVDYRRRIQLSLESFSTAGPRAAYAFHALTHPLIKDVAVYGPSELLAITPGDVHVYLLSTVDNGEANPDTVAAVSEILSAEDVRPLTDNVMVFSAEITHYEIEAELFTFAGPDPLIVLAAAEAAIDLYVAERHRIGATVTLSGIYAALHVAGVQRVALTKPTAAIETDEVTAPYCVGITLTHGGIAS